MRGLEGRVIVSIAIVGRALRPRLGKVLAVLALAVPFNVPAATPTLSGSPATKATVGTAYSFKPTARDADGDPITFSISNRPSWLAFSSSTGKLSGTPKSVGTYSNIQIYAVARGQKSKPLTFSSAVAKPSASTQTSISGTPPATALVGDTYRFQPSSQVPSGSTKAFSITNKPRWATFSTTTGVLTGQPTLSHVGTYSNIVIKLSDGQTTKSLPAFGITVAAASSGTATLAWLPPTSNSNGTSLKDLAGYRIYHGDSAQLLNKQIQISNPGMTAYVVSNLTSGKHYFAVAAYNTSGVESALSNVVSKSVY